MRARCHLIASGRVIGEARGGGGAMDEDISALLEELSHDATISDQAQAVAARASAHFLAAAYQRLAFAAVFHGSSLQLPGGAAATIEATARLPRAALATSLAPDGVTIFKPLEVVAGWVEILLPSLRRVVGAPERGEEGGPADHGL